VKDSNPIEFAGYAVANMSPTVYMQGEPLVGRVQGRDQIATCSARALQNADAEAKLGIQKEVQKVIFVYNEQMRADQVRNKEPAKLCGWWPPAWKNLTSITYSSVIS
jgi:hypothetical protein